MRIVTNFCLLILFLIIKLSSCEELLVETVNGVLKGLSQTRQFSENKTYYSFYSVRYAEPPIGSLRFQAPEPVKPWNDTYDATFEKNYCFQVTTNSEDESEDCLFLNVFTSKYPNASNKLPVMFFLHGGGFKEGSGLVKGGIGPEFFMDHDLVFVSANYRLGPFGFFSSGDEAIPGNAGLKDVHLALKWVNQNIEFFGGDPGKVTIFGNSAGSAAVSYQLLYPESEGLFRGVILISGTSLNPWAYQEDQVNITYKTAAYIDPKFNSSENRNSTALLHYLQNVEARAIDNASNFYLNTETTENLQIQQGFYYGPFLETHSNDPFLTKRPFESFKSGDYLKVPIMIGTMAEEGLSLLTDYFHWTLSDYDNNPKWLVPKGMHIFEDNVRVDVGGLIKAEYTPDEPFQENILAGIKFHSDQDFTKSLLKDARLQSNNSEVYFYEFGYHGAMGDFPQELFGAGNVSHGEDQNYIFNKIMWYSKLNNANLSQFSDEDITVHRRYLKLLVNFATYLNPTPEDDDLLQNIRWPVIRADNFQYLHIGTNLTVKNGLREEKFTFWQNIYDKYGVAPFETF